MSSNDGRCADRSDSNDEAPPDREALSLAYRNDTFLDAPEGRPLRILAEYLEPLYRFKREQIHDTVVFFGSARLREDGPLGHYYREARELARQLTEWSNTLPGCCRFVVCSGGGGGIMEAANRGATDAGGRTIGLNIGLPHEQRPNPFITDGLSLEFHYFFMRKLWFSHLARALVGVSWRLWYSRRAHGSADFVTDRQARAEDLHRSLRHEVLAGAPQL